MAAKSNPNSSSSLDWDGYQDEILDLFISKNKPLREVAKHMRDKRGFDATERQYKHRFPGLKNVKEDEWRFIADEYDRRAALGLESVAYLHGKPLPARRVARGFMRVQGTRHRIAKPAPTPARISVRTPPPSTDPTTQEPTPSPTVDLFPEASVSECYNVDEAAGDSVQVPGENMHNDSVNETGTPHLENMQISPNPEVDMNFTISSPLNLGEWLGGSDAFVSQTVDGIISVENTTMLDHGIPGLTDLGLFDADYAINTGRHHHTDQVSEENPNSLTKQEGIAGQEPIFRHTGLLSNPRSPQRISISPTVLSVEFRNTSHCPQTPSALFRRSRTTNFMADIPWFQLLSIIEKPGFSPFSQPRSSNLHAERTSAGPVTNRASSGFLIVGRYILPGLDSLQPEPSTDGDITLISSQLQELIPERQCGELYQKLHQIFDPSSPILATLPWLFAVATFFISNNMASDTITDNFLTWIVDQKYIKLLAHFIQAAQASITHAFAAVLVKSAIRIKSIQVIDELVRRGVNLDSVLDEVASFGNIDLTERVLAGADPACFKQRIGAKLFHRFVSEHTFLLAKRMLDQGVDVDVILDQQTALMSRVEEGDKEAVRFLLEAGADVDRKFYKKSATEPSGTLLQIAISSKFVEVSSMLIVNGADILCFQIEGKEAVQWTSMHCREIHNLIKDKLAQENPALAIGDLVGVACSGVPALKEFINGQSTPVTTQQLEEALEGSIHMGRLAAALTLLDYGVNPDGPSLYERPIKQLFRSQLENEKKFHFAELLLRYKADVSPPGLLADMIKSGSPPELLKMVLARGVSLDEQIEALLKAVMKEDIVAAEVLIQAGVNVDTPGTNHQNPIQTAADYGKEDMILFLLSRGANINAPACPDGGFTALQAALASETARTTGRLLLRNGADASAQPALINGNNALEAWVGNFLISPQASDPEFCLELLDAGATVNRPNNQPSSAIHGVIEKGWNDVLAHFLEPKHNAIIDRAWCDPLISQEIPQELLTPTQRAADWGRLEALKMLLDHGTSVNEPAEHTFGRTALQAAAQREPGPEKTKLIQFLLDRGADIHADPSLVKGITALQGAAIAGDLKLAELFLSMGADVNEPPSFREGRYAIEGAAEHGRLDMVQLLLNAGAKGNVQKGTGLADAIKLAEEKEHFAIANILKAQDKVGGKKKADSGPPFA